MSYVSQGFQQASQPPLQQPTALYPSSQIATQQYLPRIPSFPDTTYGTNQHYAQQTSGVRTEVAPYRLPQPARHLDSVRHPIPLGQHYFVDHLMNPHPYSALYPGFDINAVRRKNATRETTGPLKHWLVEHRKNPYPTKGDKIMLAIATRMTLTQVSTWFANARRRMKKDRGDDDDDESVVDIDTKGSRDRSGSLSSQVSLISNDANTSKENDTSKEFDESELEDLDLNHRPVRKCVQRLFSPDIRDDHVTDPSSSPESITGRLPVVSNSSCPLPESLPDVSKSSVISPSNIDISSVMATPIASSIVSTSDNLPTSTDADPQRQKIWSISEIIGSASKTISAGMVSPCLPVNYHERFVLPPSISSTYTSDFSSSHNMPTSESAPTASTSSEHRTVSNIQYF